MTADLIFDNGTVHTVSATGRIAGAVAVENGRISAVGESRDVAALRGPQTRVIDMQGGMLLPGFQDAHAHPAQSGFGRTQCSLTEIVGREATCQAIAAYASANPDRDWILGSGWSMGDFPGGVPTREELDALVPDRPAALINRDYHGMWVNSRAIETIGITDATPDPEGGRIERDASGRAVGMLQELAQELAFAVIPETTVDDLVTGIRIAQEYYFSLGITAWADAVVRPDVQEAYMRLARSGELKVRARGMLAWEPAEDLSQIEQLQERRIAGSVGRLDCGEVKFFHDGVFENFTAAMLEPYLDSSGNPTQNRGLDQYDLDVLTEAVTACDAAGFQVHIHALGDRAVRECIDVFEHALRQNGRRDSRHHLAHLQFVDPVDIPRLRQVGLTANMTPLWAQREDSVELLTLPFVTDAVGRTMYPLGSIHRAGARIAFGSDWSVSTPAPLEQLSTAVNRRDTAKPESVALFAEETLDLETAIAAQTVNAAYVGFLDDRTGTIEAGKLADLVLLDRDLFAAGDEGIKDARTLMTVVEGETVYAADGWS